MRHLVLTILLYHIVYHLLAAYVVKVGIYIRHALTVRVKETLKQQLVLYGVYIGDAYTIGHRRTRG